MKPDDTSLNIIREYELFTRRENTQPHMSYAHEKERHRIIREGRTDLVEKILNVPPDGTSGVLSHDELRNLKNLFISAITLFTRAAMDGGLPEEIAYAMSDSYIQNGEACTTPDEIDVLYHQALRTFTAAVAEKGNRHYSTLIENTIHYIQIHLHEKITLEDTAAAVNVNAFHLCRIFKKETGISFVEYIQKERVESARHMLIYSYYTSSEISQYLNFSTQSYFIKIFKKYTGMTPEMYRKHYRLYDNW